MKNKKILIISMITIFALTCITIGVSLTFFNYTGTGTTDNTVETGSITFLYTETSSIGRGISITDAFPTSNEEGKALTGEGKVFDFNISSTKTFNKNINYEVTARKNNNSTLDDDLVVMYLTKVDGINEEEVLLDKYNNLTQTEKTTSYTEKVLYTGLVDTTDTTYDQDFRLRMWITDDGTYTEDDMGNSFMVTVNVYANASVVEAPQAKLYTIVNDANSNGTADIGDEIAIGDEHFYVISNDGTNINALSKYNLNVGDYALESTIGIQNASAIGFPTQNNVTVPFSSGSQKGTNYSDYQGSIVEGYVNNYVTYLNTNNTGLNATGRLILREEIESLVNDGASLSGGNINTKADAKGYSWIYSTSYWSGFSNGAYYVWNVRSDGYFNSYHFYNHDVDFGVRPVITIGA